MYDVNICLANIPFLWHPQHMKMTLISALSTLIFLLPVFAFAQGTGQLQNATGVIFDIAQRLLPIVVTLALLFFFWNIIKFILALGRGEDSKTAGRSALFWGIVALFVMVSVWGIVGLLGEIFGVGQGGTMEVPGIIVPGE
jgi:hypothetical protein